jgi:tetratricopeptide (TPR) repeat protein
VVTDYLAAARTSATGPDPRTGQGPDREQAPVTAGQARAAVLLLHRYGLASIDERAGPRAVRVHALTQRAVLEHLRDDPLAVRRDVDDAPFRGIFPEAFEENLFEAFEKNLSQRQGMGILPAWKQTMQDALDAATRRVTDHARRAKTTSVADVSEIVRVGADAVLSLWPDLDHTDIELVAVLRANTAALAAQQRDLLWDPEPHPVLSRAGNSLLAAGLHTLAATYWQDYTETAKRKLGAEHPVSLIFRHNLAMSIRAAGRLDEAITIQEQVTADMARVLGAEHVETLAARNQLASSYGQAGRIGEAITLLEQVAADTERILGPEHPDTLTARANLAVCYGQAGRIGDAITPLEQVAADRARILGPEHPDTLRAYLNLAAAYRQAGRTAEAITLGERVTADMVRILGPEHPTTVVAVTQWLHQRKRRPLRLRWR